MTQRQQENYFVRRSSRAFAEGVDDDGSSEMVEVIVCCSCFQVVIGNMRVKYVPRLLTAATPHQAQHRHRLQWVF